MTLPSVRAKIIELVPDAKEPIGIREVLMAIQNHGNKTVDSMELQLSYGTLHLKTKNGGFAKWNIEKDNLNEQSSETIELLATILWVKR